MRTIVLFSFIFLLTDDLAAQSSALSESKSAYPFISGVYPHLAMYNEEDSECGTGALVVWADRLWAVTYSAHKPFGSSDKLYEVTQDLEQIIRPESVGGTPANRMIHTESKQLFIGPYAIDHERSVRVIPFDKMPGRPTGTARHLTDPENKIYTASMEEGFYEINVQDLSVKTLYEDSNPRDGLIAHDPTDINPSNATLPGAHGKGLYSGQGVLVYSNNGEAVPEALHHFAIESGSLSEWDGSAWKLIRRNQFVEVTGPGGIYGNQNPDTDPIWTTGWDHRSILVGCRDEGQWSFYRLPKASHSYDGAHGWNTEWPRIRNIGTREHPSFLMTMHGLFWYFPANFSHLNSAGIHPYSAYLKVIGDFTRWNDQIVFACDDSAHREFLNKRKVKGTIEGPGQSHSNLWFVNPDQLSNFGPAHASGSVWLEDDVQAGDFCEPFLFSGWTYRTAWVYHENDEEIDFTFEVDRKGDNSWSPLSHISVQPNKAHLIHFSDEQRGEWIRVFTDKNTRATVHFSYSNDDNRTSAANPIFDGLARVGDKAVHSGLLYSLGNNRGNLGLTNDNGYFELNKKLKLHSKLDLTTAQFIQSKFEIPKNVVSIESGSVLIVDDAGRRWRLPLGDDKFSNATKAGELRLCREVATERDLFNCHGTFYELPAENADGFAKIRPIASHNYFIHDYASFRGMLVMTGIAQGQVGENKHIVEADDGGAAVWVGVIDDLWKMGKPRGRGGPWKQAKVKANIPSDPYLFGFYNKRTLRLSHEEKVVVDFTIELEPVGHGPWMEYKEISVAPGETESFEFPAGTEARWIRIKSDKDCVATAWLEYE